MESGSSVDSCPQENEIEPYKNKNKRGGKRKNSGRKFQNKTKIFLGFKYTPEEFEELNETFEFLKEKMKMNNTQLLKHIITHFSP
mgnify:CR=1 FL=1